MEIRKILADLKGERNRIARAVAALEVLGSIGGSVPRGRPAEAAKAAPKPGKRGLTPAGRRRLSALMKARWAARRKAAAPAPKPSRGRRRMSAAARKKIAVAQKARWAARKKAAAKKAPVKKAPVVKKVEAPTAPAE